MNIEQPHYTVNQLAEMWNVSRQTIRRMFMKEPGVVRLHGSRPATGHRREYNNWRIPKDVAERVYNRDTVKGAAKP